MSETITDVRSTRFCQHCSKVRYVTNGDLSGWGKVRNRLECPSCVANRRAYMRGGPCFSKK